MDVVNSSRFKKTKLMEHNYNLYDTQDSEHVKEKQDDFNEKLAQTMDVFKNMGEPCKQLLMAFYFENPIT